MWLSLPKVPRLPLGKAAPKAPILTTSSTSKCVSRSTCRRTHLTGRKPLQRCPSRYRFTAWAFGRRQAKQYDAIMDSSPEASWASLATNELLGELKRRAESGDRPACGGKGQGKYDTIAHVFALLLILVLSTLGCGFPLLGRQATSGQRQTQFIFYCQHIGTGVLLATAFVHLLPTAFESLTDPCLPYFFSKGYKPFPGLIGLVSAIIVVGVESYLTARGAGHSHSHSHAVWDDDAHEMHGFTEEEEGPRARYDDDATEGLVAGASAIAETIPAKARKSQENDFHDGDSDLDLDLAELDPAPTGDHSNGQYASLKANGHSKPQQHRHEELTPDQQKRQMLQCLLLEAGILFHSVFIGMALSVATGPMFVVFLIAVSFHQSFEGMALGSRIAAIQFPRGSLRPWLMVLAYGVTTPIGQAIGLFVHRIYDPASMGGLIVVGTMNAISAGLLLYAGLVQLLAEDFLSEKSYKVLKGKRRLHAYLCVVAGAVLMALVGAFA